MQKSLIQKYDVAAPRYTSYPTVPYWQNKCPTKGDWITSIHENFDPEDGISLYIHLPYCESMCTFCGCNKRITKNHEVELPYIDSIIQEWRLYLEVFAVKPKIKEIHLGGGTPTFFSPENLGYLIDSILSLAQLDKEYEFGFEAHPANTTEEHLKILFDRGFRRLSIGIQDFDSEILAIINRRQDYDSVERLTNSARTLGYESINFDLVFGLPLQTKDHIRNTIEKVNTLSPDRIAFYSYAHVPWVKPGQRAYSEKDLPLGKDKRTLYELGRSLLENSGYVEIGMDHFALKTDGLYKAKIEGRLHRNFMGYTSEYSKIMIGLGASSISDSWSGYVQNEKKIEDYRQRVAEGSLPFFRGHMLTNEDIEIRTAILNLMCKEQLSWSQLNLPAKSKLQIENRLEELKLDGLIRFEEGQLIVTERGIPFIRNIGMALDLRYHAQVPEGKIFSQVV